MSAEEHSSRSSRSRLERVCVGVGRRGERRGQAKRRPGAVALQVLGAVVLLQVDHVAVAATEPGAHAHLVRGVGDEVGLAELTRGRDGVLRVLPSVLGANGLAVRHDAPLNMVDAAGLEQRRRGRVDAQGRLLAVQAPAQLLVAHFGAAYDHGWRGRQVADRAALAAVAQLRKAQPELWPGATHAEGALALHPVRVADEVVGCVLLLAPAERRLLRVLHEQVVVLDAEEPIGTALGAQRRQP
mmetsp:Transcript_34451/g.75689  ORF Transcript_34451/g.75689 Transcript_34451/m.75689 type:complete len:242 (+) Transcript_34451:434-1159(+)